MGSAPHPVRAWLGLAYEAPDGDGRLRARFVPDPARHRGAPGFLHGGVAATVLDETMAAVGFVLDGVHTATATLELRYRRPVPLDGRAVTAEAWREAPEAPGRTRRRRVRGRLLLADGTVAVEARGIFVPAPAGMRRARGEG